MLALKYYDNVTHIVWVRYTICYLGSVIIMWAYCVGKVHNI